MSDSVKLKVGQSDLLCRNGCGFFGNPEWSWYCSQCWRKQNSNIHSYQFDPAPGGTPSHGGAPPGSPYLGSGYASGAQRSPQFYSPGPTVYSQSLPMPLNKDRPTSFSSMMRKSPAQERKLKLPSAQHMAAEITNKMNQTKRLHSQTLDRSSSNIKQMFKKGPNRKEEKVDRLETGSNESKVVSKEFGEFLHTRVKKPGMADLSRNIQSLIDKVNKRVDILPIEEVAAMVQNFYQALVRRLETHENFQGISQEDIKTIEDYTERYIMINLYKQLFSPASTGDEEKDLEIQSKIRSLNWVTSSHLDCPFKETDPDIRDLIYTAINHVLEVDGSKAPQDKLTSIVACAKTIFSILGAGGKGPASADDFLPSLIYIIMKANPPRITSNINFITRFTNEHRLRSGEEGYYFTNLCCALSFIENLKAESLNLPEEEFKQYMSGECIPPGSWETSLLMCEGIQTMSHNLKTLAELTELQERILQDAEVLEQEMKEWELTLRTEVEAVLHRTQYTIRGPKKPADVDSEFENTLPLPAPLLPERVVMDSVPSVHRDSPPMSEQLNLFLHSSIPTASRPVTPSRSVSSNLLPAAEERSLIDETPTDELLAFPLQPTSGPKGGVVESAAARPPAEPLTNYIGFSAQASSIPSISCSTAESDSPFHSALRSSTFPPLSSPSPTHPEASASVNHTPHPQHSHPS